MAAPPPPSPRRLRLAHGAVALRSPRLRDGPAWVAARQGAERWLAPWEAVPPDVEGLPWRARQGLGAWVTAVRALRAEARAGAALPAVVLVDGRFAGQVSVTGVVGGAARSGTLGYWVDRERAGRGVGTTAVALLAQHALTTAGLHRLDALVRPENTASLRLLARLGFREEGLVQRALRVDGDWRDHRLLALTAEELPPGGLLGRLPARPLPG